jgi:hypothetical protein
MALLTKEIETILKGKGLLKFPNRDLTSNQTVETATGDRGVENSYNKNNLTVDTNSNAIMITGMNKTAQDNNCINVMTLDQVSAIGCVKVPGYVYTGNFSGCVFYLYKTGTNEVTGVHAYNGEVITTKQRFLLGPKDKKEVREFGPTDYYTRNPALMICRYPTRGELLTGAKIGAGGAEDCLNFLSCVEQNSATTFLFSTKVTPDGYRIARVLARHWTRF